MKNPREKLRVESVESQIPRARREKLLMRRLSVDRSFLGLRQTRREDCACRRTNGVVNSSSRRIMQNVDIDCKSQFKRKGGTVPALEGNLYFESNHNMRER